MNLRLLVGSALGFTLTACLSPGAPPPALRYFHPISAVSTAEATGKAVRLGRVTAAPHLDRRFAVRVGDREFAYDEGNRWTGDPSDLVHEAVELALFASGAFTRSADPRAPAVEVHVESFELQISDPPRARVVLRALLPGGVVHPVAGVAPATGADAPALADAMAVALGQAVGQLRAALTALMQQ